jgi:MFS family permease
MNQKRLFLASCVALIATSMSFAIRGDIMGELEGVFELSKTDLGWIAGAAFWGFGLSIFIGGPLCDVLGMKNIMRMAALGHIGGTILTLVAAPSFAVLFAATLIIGIANGLVEAAINPLVATIYPEEKTKKLVILHAWFPGGIVIGGVIAFIFSKMGLGWQAKMGLMFVPSVIYLFMYVGQEFPKTERVASGVSFGDMFKEAFRPLFIVIFACMWLTAATELGPGQWIANIFNDVMGARGAGAGILLLVWINGIMYVLRQFGGGIAHKVSPVGLIAFSSVFAFAGLWLYSIASGPVMWFVAAAIFAFGVAYWWPSMLGITSERFPKGGALLLAIIGGSGAISTAAAGPIMGLLNDKYGAEKVLPIWSALPVVIFVVFLIIYLKDRAAGGYKAEVIGETPAND